jgi:caa(3)-type oxidase subunit IV
MANMAHDDKSHLQDVDSPPQLFVIFIVLAALAVLTVFLAQQPMGGSWNLITQMSISVVQAFLVGYYFMHLKKADSVTLLTAAATLFFLAIMFVLVLSDVLSRQYGGL